MVLVKPATRNEPPSSDQKVPHRTFQIPFDDEFLETLIVKTAMEEGMWKAMINAYETQRVTCELLLNNTELLQELRNSNFDLIVHEGIAVCASLVADLLGIPKVVILCGPPNSPDSYLYKVPFPASYIPSYSTAFTSEMSFAQRVVNVVAHNFFQFMSEFLSARYMGFLKEKYNISPEISYSEAVGNAELVLFPADFAIEYSQPLLPGLPNII